MKETPILFSAPLVRAILEGRKTQTRRPLNPALISIQESGIDAPYLTYDTRREGVPRYWKSLKTGEAIIDDNPFGQPGDRLWVRETWQGWIKVNTEYDEWEHWDRRDPIKLRPDSIAYRADGKYDDEASNWRPSIHMPRWASRLTLEIENVRVERVQEISEEDAKAEGVVSWRESQRIFEKLDAGKLSASDVNGMMGCPVVCFQKLWTSVYPGSWERNDWVWVVDFRRTAQ